jgi:hypothetical protein
MCGSTGLLAPHAVTILLSVNNHSHRHVGPVRLRYGRNLHSTPRAAGSAARPYVFVTPGPWLAGTRGGWFILVPVVCRPASISLGARFMGWSIGQGLRTSGPHGRAMARRPLSRFDPPSCATWTWLELDGSLDAAAALYDCILFCVGFVRVGTRT